MLTRETRDQLLDLTTAMVADAMSTLNLPERVVKAGIRPVVPFTRMAGTAITVSIRSQPDPSKAGLQKYSGALQGHFHNNDFSIICIQLPVEQHRRGIFGEGSATMARQHGIVGALVEGAVRDSTELKEMNFPVFSRRIAPGYIVHKVEAVSVNERVTIGGLKIYPGQIIFGDNDGVVVIDPAELEPVIEKAREIVAWEIKHNELLAQGMDYNEALKYAPEP